MPTGTVSFRVYTRLNDFVSADRRARRFVHILNGRSSVKDAIEALGVPHPEVDVILVNGTPVGFTYLVQDGDAVAVYPTFQSIDLGDLQRVGAAVPEPIRFVVDVHLRKLASLSSALPASTPSSSKTICRWPTPWRVTRAWC